MITGYDAWYGDTVYQLELLIECTTSDAQGIIDAHEATLTSCWLAGYTPEQAATEINKVSIVHP